MSGPETTTAWTPTVGDVVGLPFVWRDGRELKERSAAVALLHGEKALIVGLSNPSKHDGNPVSELAWIHADGEGRTSLVYNKAMQVNILPLRVLLSSDKVALRGHLDGTSLSTLQRRLFGGLIMGVLESVSGLEWVSQGIYQPVMVVKGEKGLVIRQDEGEHIRGVV
jgi:hypothetical protein